MQPGSRLIKLNSGGGLVKVYLSPDQPATIHIPQGATTSVHEDLDYSWNSNVLHITSENDAHQLLASRLQVCAGQNSGITVIEVCPGKFLSPSGHGYSND